MFAAIYFAQVAFAALPLVGTTPPPPPPPPIVTVEECELFAVGDCIGVQDVRLQVPRLGQSSCVRSGMVIGMSGSSGLAGPIGVDGGRCP